MYSINQIGAYVSYEYVSGNAYEVSLHVYRDCRGVGFQDTLAMKVEGDNGCFTSISFDVVLDTIINQTVECSLGNSCSVPNGRGSRGVEEIIYSAIVDLDLVPFKTILDNNCCDVYFTFTDCCRSGAITTGISGSLTNYAYLNRCYGKINTSVVYANKLAAQAYCNTTFEYNPFAIDDDGDSLVFSLDTPLGSSRTSPLSYNAPLSARIPFTPVCTNLSVNCPPVLISGFYTGFDFDTVTNNMRVTPKNCLEVTSFVNRTDEYRKDTGGIWRLIGITRRDQLLFNSQINNNLVPSLNVGKEYFACVGDTFALNLFTQDLAPTGGISDSTFLTWEHSLNNGSITLNDTNAKNQSALLKWAPDTGDISTIAQYVHLSVTESNCSSNSSISKTIVLYAVDSLSSNYTLTDRMNGTLVVDANITGGSSRLPNQISWLIDTIANFSTARSLTREVDSLTRLEPGKYYVRLFIENNTNCTIFLTDSITISPYFRFNFNSVPKLICNKNEVKIAPNIKDATRPITYQWYINGSPTQISSDSFIQKNITSEITYLLNAKDAAGQNYFETITLKTKDLPDLSSVKNPDAKCFSEGKFDLYENSPIGIGLNQSIKDSNIIQFMAVDSRRALMVKQGIGKPYWYNTERFFNTSLNNGYIPSPGVDTVRIFAQNIHTGCTDSTDFTVQINANPIIKLKQLNLCQADGVFNVNQALVDTPINPDLNRYTWTIDSAPTGLSTFDLSQILIDEDPNPLQSDYVFYPYLKGSHPSNPANNSRVGTYKLRFCFTELNTNCLSCDSTYVQVDPTPHAVLKPFSKLCYDDPIVRLDSFVNLTNGRWELKHFNGDSTGMNYNAALARMIDSTQISINTPENTKGTYFWRYVNETKKCISTDSIEMVVNERPTLQLNIDKDTIYLGETILLNIVQGSGLNLKWENGNINPSRLIREFATTEGENKYIMSGTDPSTSCTAKDTASIWVIKTKRPTSIQDLKAMGLKIYPNPTSSLLYIHSLYPYYEIKLMDPMGKQIFARNDSEIYESTIDLSKFANGTYFIQISGTKGTAYSQIIITK